MLATSTLGDSIINLIDSQVLECFKSVNFKTFCYFWICKIDSRNNRKIGRILVSVLFRSWKTSFGRSLFISQLFVKNRINLIIKMLAKCFCDENSVVRRVSAIFETIPDATIVHCTFRLNFVSYFLMWYAFNFRMIR